MRYWLVPLLLAYLGAALLDGIRGVLALMAIGVTGTTVLVGGELVADWRRGRAEREAVRRRWAQWKLEDELRRFGWRRRDGA